MRFIACSPATRNFTHQGTFLLVIYLLGIDVLNLFLLKLNIGSTAQSFFTYFNIHLRNFLSRRHAVTMRCRTAKRKQ